jgi:phospholipid/cholesterol/gamma-HCH transport system substrate-binding protein
MDEYRKHIRWAKLRVGIVITVALAVIFLAVMFSGHIEGIFKPQAILYADFYDVRGLKTGAPVWFSGIEIGRVKSMSFYKGREIRVLMSVDRNVLKHLRKDSSVTILTLGLLGDKYLELSPGSGESPGLRDGDSLIGSAQLEFQDIMEKSKESISRLSDLAKRLDSFIAMIEKGEGTVPMLLRDRALYDNLRDSAKSLSIVMNRIEKGGGTIGKLLSDEKLYAKLEFSVNNIKEFSDDLNKSNGTLNRLIKDRELYDKFLNTSSSLDEITKKLAGGKGTAGRLLEDDSVYENLDSASRKLSQLLQRIEEGKGVLGDLTSEGELHTDLKTTVKDLNGLIKDIKENPKRYFKFSLF